MALISWIILIIIVIIFILVAIFKSIAAHKDPIKTGAEAFVGKKGVAKTDLNPTGKFYVNGEYWDAEVKGTPLKAGEKGQVVGIGQADEKYLIVEKL
jgi:membrane-bound serine protease (ClpP class)